MNFQNERPIYLQIVEQMEMEIMSGHYPKGSKLPTVRELAMQYKVNPNTMQKAFVELEQRGLVFAKRTSGRYVSENESVIENVKQQAAKAKTQEYIRYVRQLGLEEEDILRLFKECGKGENDEHS
ncbi:GntR family transcriptional regulator [Amedibacillus dolichus]|uniref:GntR family transcriptional regulator n=1 Tax=Amedibacillus dolichus TaxID=31971 RepID=UPI0039A0B2DB